MPCPASWPPLRLACVLTASAEPQVEVAQIAGPELRREIKQLQTKIKQVNFHLRASTCELPRAPSALPLPSSVRCMCFAARLHDGLDRSDPCGLQEGGGTATGADPLRRQLSDILTRDCPACGELLVETIDKPFEGGKLFD